jgi:hypothetical protein
MGSEIYRLKKQKAAKQKLEHLFDRSDLSLIIHYSCESFFKRDDGKSPRIASIAIRYLHSGEIRSFSIHHYAEKLNVASSELDNEYEKIELELLKDYFKFVADHYSYYWAHWNMRNINYGFQALEHRFQVLGGEPKVLPESRKVDLASTLQDIYGVEYAKKPVLATLCNLNEIKSELFLPGADEADAFERGEYMKLYQSTQKKVDFISYVAELSLKNKLKTDATFWSRYGAHPKIIIEIIREHWFFGGLAVIAIFLSIGRLFF